MKIHYLNSNKEEKFLDNIMHLQNVDNRTWDALTKDGKELTLLTERIEGIADTGLIVPGNQVVLNLPCIREVNTALGKYEAVYINKPGLIQSAIVDTELEGWNTIEHLGNDYCKRVARAKLGV
jgi:hypothetical protein